jgi:transposase
LAIQTNRPELTPTSFFYYQLSRVILYQHLKNPSTPQTIFLTNPLQQHSNPTEAREQKAEEKHPHVPPLRTEKEGRKEERVERKADKLHPQVYRKKNPAY